MRITLSRPAIMPTFLMDELANALSGNLWRYVQLADCSHMLSRDRPTEVATQLREFVLAHAELQPSQTPPPS